MSRFRLSDRSCLGCNLGCLVPLLIFVMIMGACYWLFLSPMDLEKGLPDRSDEVVGDVTPLVDGELNQVQEQALSTLAQESDAPVTILAPQGQIQYLTTNVSVPDSIAVNPQAKALYFLKQHSDLFQLENPGKNLRFERTIEDGVGNTFVRYTQQYQGVPVFGSNMIVGINGNVDNIESVNGGYVKNLEVNVYPDIRSIAAEDTILKEIGIETAEIIGPTSLVIYAPELWDIGYDQVHLAWLVVASSSKPSTTGFYFIDAHTGELINFTNVIFDIFEENPNHEIWDAQGLEKDAIDYDHPYDNVKLLVNKNGNIVVDLPDDEAKKAWDILSSVDRYYWETFDRDGFDDDNTLLRLYVNTSRDENCRAWWSGIYTDKYVGFFFPRDITVGLIFVCEGWVHSDVLAHEFTHGVVESTAGWGIEGETIAVNEAFADIFAAFMDEVNPWQITGADEDGSNIRRDIKDPVDGYPTHYDGYCVQEENGCCNKIEDSNPLCGHVNSLILSHSAYLMSEYGVSRKKLQYIFYHTLTNSLGPTATLKSTALTLLGSCHRLKGSHEITESDCEKVLDALVAVGLIDTPTSSNPDPLPIPIPSLPPVENWVEDLQGRVRDWIDQQIGDLRQRIEDYLQEQVEKLLQALEQGADQFIQMLIEELLNLFSSLLQQCCLGWMLAPLAALLWHRKRSL